MPFDPPRTGPRHVAVIGAGISGLAAAWALRHRHRVTLLESAPRLGGHARTVIAGRRGDQPVDTGFIVFNRVNYPGLVEMFEELRVPVASSDMGFAASFGGGALEYGLRNLRTLYAQPSNLLSPAFHGMVRDILRFNARAREAVRPTQSLGDLLDVLGTGEMFRDRYILPFSAAIWSTPAADMLEFPAESFVRFFENHGLLQTSGHHPWLTVEGGSTEYVSRLGAALEGAGVEVRTGARVTRLARPGDGVEVTCERGEPETFDAAIVALHADDALAILSDPSEAERRDLAAVRYQPNRAVLHADPSAMPTRRSVWASWNYIEGADPEHLSLSYWMNRLQPIPEDDPLFVTLNPTHPIDPAATYDETVFRHPVYDGPAEVARRAIAGWNGARGTWFCGAWMRDGFHEDGLQSAFDAVQGFESGLVVQAEAAE